jgi:hypothetical protein
MKSSANSSTLTFSALGPMNCPQPQFIGPPLPAVNNLCIAIFYEGRDVFERSPAGDMPFIAIAEHSIQETGSA